MQRKICKETCCAKTVAISLDQDEDCLINTVDGLDLADVLLKQNKKLSEINKFFAPILSDEKLPCLQPGTIIHINNRKKAINYFFRKLRPKMTTPYLIITSRSNGDSPGTMAEKLVTDDLLLRWYGTNPLLQEVKTKGLKKLEPSPLGLNKYHPQTPYLARYLEMQNFTNPFWGKEQKH